MTLYSLSANKSKRKIFRILFLIAGISLIVIGIIKAWFIIIAGLYLIIMIPFIKDVELHIYEDRIEVLHISLIKKLNDTENFHFNLIKSIKFDKGFTNWKGLLIESNIAYTNTTYTKKDTIEINLKDSNWRIINRIYTKDMFYQACQIIIKQLQTTNNSN